MAGRRMPGGDAAHALPGVSTRTVRALARVLHGCFSCTACLRDLSCCCSQLLEARDGEEDAELSAEQGKPETPEEEALPGVDLA